METFPDVDPALRDEAATTAIERWLVLRGVVAQAIEPARQAKTIGNALEAAVTLELADAAEVSSLEGKREELEEFIILSELTLAAGTETTARLVRTENKKCARCWRHRLTVGAAPEHPELCERCAEVCR